MNHSESIIRRAPRAASHFKGFRRFNRKDLEIELLVQDDFGWEIPLDSVDLSATGMFVASPALFEVGDEHVLHFSEGATNFRVRARVVRVTDDVVDERIDPNVPVAPGMGYEFLDVDDRTWDALCEMVQTV